MEGEIILDTGPLIAYLDRREKYHTWAAGIFDGLTEAVVTCAAVITEACFLLRSSPAAQYGIGELMARGIVQGLPVLPVQHARVFAFMQKYADTPMSLADACLVSMAEALPRSRVLTLDSDFTIYRLKGGRAVPRLAPF